MSVKKTTAFTFVAALIIGVLLFGCDEDSNYDQRTVVYVSNINATSSYDIFITFAKNEISSNVVGLTSYKWNPITQDPTPPLTINITTYRSIDLEFVARVYDSFLW